MHLGRDSRLKVSNPLLYRNLRLLGVVRDYRTKESAISLESLAQSFQRESTKIHCGHRFSGVLGPGSHDFKITITFCGCERRMKVWGNVYAYEPGTAPKTSRTGLLGQYHSGSNRKAFIPPRDRFEARVLIKCNISEQEGKGFLSISTSKTRLKDAARLL